MSKPQTISDIDESLSPTDREDFSLFLRYPEIEFDILGGCSSKHSSVALTPKHKDNLHSSPLSTAPSPNYRDISFVTDSTAHTTPNRPLATNGNDLEFGGWNEFIYLMQRSRLPPECLQYLTSLAQTILNIGTILHSTLRPSQAGSVVRIGTWLLNSIRYSSNLVASQVEAIQHLESLVAFKVHPDEPHLWSTYRQRARLIVKHVSLPSKNELKLVKSLVFLYDAYVYNPFLNHCPTDPSDKKTTSIINDIYDKLMTWLQNYKQWCRGMSYLRTHYMQPLLVRLSKTEHMQEEVKDFRSRVSAAREVRERVADLTNEQVINNLNLSARKPDSDASSRRSRTRYKREHTL